MFRPILCLTTMKNVLININSLDCLWFAVNYDLLTFIYTQHSFISYLAFPYFIFTYATSLPNVSNIPGAHLSYLPSAHSIYEPIVYLPTYLVLPFLTVKEIWTSRWNSGMLHTTVALIPTLEDATEVSRVSVS